jgi:hypothetical protein
MGPRESTISNLVDEESIAITIQGWKRCPDFDRILGSVAAQDRRLFRSAFLHNHFCHRAARHGNNCVRAPLRRWC